MQNKKNGEFEIQSRQVVDSNTTQSTVSGILLLVLIFSNLIIFEYLNLS